MMKNTTWLALTATLSMNLLACGGGADTDKIPDPEPPTVLSVSPEDGEAGVYEDEVVVVQFSRKMDGASVEGAYASDDLPAAEVSFGWNGAGDRLTITPLSPLEYAETFANEFDELEPLEFAFTIGTGATDDDGLALEAPFSAAFTTKRRIHAAPPVVASHTRSWHANGLFYDAVPGIFVVGEHTTDNAATALTSHLTFDISVLPEGITELEVATISARQAPPTGSPYAEGPLFMYHAIFDEVWPGALLSYEPHTFSTNGEVATKSATVTANVLDDYENGKNRSQYTLDFDWENGFIENTEVDQAKFDLNTLGMSVTYLID